MPRIILAIDAAVQVSCRERPRPCDRVRPQSFQDRPGRPEPRAVGRFHLRPVGHAPVQFGLHERADVHAVHDDVHQFTADPEVHQFGTAQPAAFDQGAAHVDK
ncbi:MAG TPA: hypothetical protein VFX16_18025 [Pseudonocardiaceae bacterium]|nr:hypothetical protein [Pseudonocardiaceae bacterium]